MVAQGEADEGLSDARARAVAGYWFDEREPSSPLSMLARDGRITGATVEALVQDLRSLEFAAGGQPSIAQRQLRQLLVYVRTNGPRGPVPEWRELPELHTPPPTSPPPREAPHHYSAPRPTPPPRTPPPPREPFPAPEPTRGGPPPREAYPPREAPPARGGPERDPFPGQESPARSGPREPSPGHEPPARGGPEPYPRGEPSREPSAGREPPSRGGPEREPYPRGEPRRDSAGRGAPDDDWLPVDAAVQPEPPLDEGGGSALDLDLPPPPRRRWDE